MLVWVKWSEDLIAKYKKEATGESQVRHFSSKKPLLINENDVSKWSGAATTPSASYQLMQDCTHCTNCTNCTKRTQAGSSSDLHSLTEWEERVRKLLSLLSSFLSLLFTVVVVAVVVTLYTHGQASWALHSILEESDGDETLQLRQLRNPSQRGLVRGRWVLNSSDDAIQSTLVASRYQNSVNKCLEHCLADGRAFAVGGETLRRERRPGLFGMRWCDRLSLHRQQWREAWREEPLLELPQC